MRHLSRAAIQHFEQLEVARSKSKLHYGSKTIGVNIYVGELDEENRACGEGVVTKPNGDYLKGTFKDDQRHGYGVSVHGDGVRWRGQQQKGRIHFKQTVYKDECVTNYEYESALIGGSIVQKEKIRTKITCSSQAFFGNGKPIKNEEQSEDLQAKWCKTQ